MQEIQHYSRGTEIGHGFHTLPATNYNNLKRLMQVSTESVLEVPVPKLQYLAVVDQNEVVFVDLHFRHVIEFAWQSLIPRDRNSLFSPVDFRSCWYNRLAHEAMLLMPEAFGAAVEKQLRLSRKISPGLTADLLAFPAEPGRKAG